MFARFLQTIVSALSCLLLARPALALSPALPPPAAGTVFASFAPLNIKLRAPFSTLFEAQSLGLAEAKKALVTGEVFVPGVGGFPIGYPVEIHMKGFSSLNTCRFPKLELKFISKPTTGLFTNIKSIDLNTHCAEQDDWVVSEYFRGSFLNHREALIYRMMDVLGMPSLRARPVFAEYEDTFSPSTVPLKKDFAYQAFFIEDMSAFTERLNAQEVRGTGDVLKDLITLDHPEKIQMFRFQDVKSSPRIDPEDVARIALLQYLVDNGDWFIKIDSEHERSHDSKINLWNTKIIQTTSGKWIPVPHDFSLSGVLLGSSIPTLDRTIFDVVSAESRKKIKKAFQNKKAELMQLPSELKDDPKGQFQIKGILERFFSNLQQL